MTDTIQDPRGLNILLRHDRLEELSRIFCDRVEYVHDRGTFKGKPIFDHHLMFWLEDKLVFKVWLLNRNGDKEYDGVEKALETVGITVVR